jgi:UDP-glucose 4-epimerase
MRDVDGVFHEAALVSVPRSIEEPELSFAINAGGTLTVFEAARRTGVRRVVCASSAAVYGDSDCLPLAEATPLRPSSPYGLDKLYLEHLGALYASLHGLETVALRYFNVFGPRQDPTSQYSGVISIFVDRLQRGEAPTVYGDGEQTRDFVYVGDVVRANLAAMASPIRGFQALNVGTGRRVSLNALLSELAAVLGVTARATRAAARPGDIRDSQADISKIGAALGYTPRWSLREGLTALVGGVSAVTDGRAEPIRVL